MTFPIPEALQKDPSFDPEKWVNEYYVVLSIPVILANASARNSDDEPVGFAPGQLESLGLGLPKDIRELDGKLVPYAAFRAFAAFGPKKHYSMPLRVA